MELIKNLTIIDFSRASHTVHSDTAGRARTSKISFKDGGVAEDDWKITEDKNVPVTRGRHMSTCHSHIVYRSHCLTKLTSTCSAIRVSNIHISTCHSHIVYRSHCLITLTSTCSAINVSNIHISTCTCHSHIVYRSHRLTTLTSTCSSIKESNMNISPCDHGDSHTVYRTHCQITLTSTCSSNKIYDKYILSNIYTITCHSHKDRQLAF